MSSYREPIIRTFIAEGDLSAKQYYFVKAGTAENQVALCGANEKSIGVLMNAPAAGEAAEVALSGGGALLKIGEASLSRGDLLTSTSTGVGEQVDAADEWCGAILEKDATLNDVAPVLVQSFYSSKSDA